VLAVLAWALVQLWSTIQHPTPERPVAAAPR
jgi:hypothetical protein